MATVTSFAQAYTKLTGKAPSVGTSSGASNSPSSFQQTYNTFIQSNKNSNPQVTKNSNPTLNVQKAFSSGGLTNDNVKLQQQTPQTNLIASFAGGMYKGVVGEVGSVLKTLQPVKSQTNQPAPVVNLPMGLKLKLVDSTQSAPSAQMKQNPQTMQAQKTAIDNNNKTQTKIVNAFPATAQQGNDIANDPLNIKNIHQILMNPKKIVTDALNTMIDSWNTAVPLGSNLGKDIKNKAPVSKTVADVLRGISATANFAFSPLTAIFDAANKVPALGTITKIITLPFTLAGEGGAAAAGKVIDHLPISQEAKNNLKPAVQEVGALAGQMALGHIMTIGEGKKAALVDKYGEKEANTISKVAVDVARQKIVKPGTYSPQDLRNEVMSKGIQETPHGQAMIKSTLQAEQEGKQISIESPNVDAFNNNIDEYRRFGGYTEGKSTENAALRDITTTSDHPEVKAHTQEKVQQAIQNGTMKIDENGDITLYRGGKPSDHNNLASASYNKDVAQNFADNAGGELHEFKVKPEDIKAFIGRSEGEVLVDKKAVKNTVKDEPHPFPQSVVKEPLLHGTPGKKFDKFDLSKAGQSDNGFAGKGIYLTNDEGSARYFADKWTSKAYPSERKGNIIKSHVDIKKPLIIKDSKDYNAYQELRRVLGAKSNDEVPVKLKEKGYDSVIVESFHSDGRPAHEYVVYDEHQTKILKEPTSFKSVGEILDKKNTRTTTEDKPNVETKHYDTKGKEIQNKKVLTGNQVKAVRDVIDAHMKHIRETSTSGEDFSKKLDKAYDDVLEKSQGDKVVLSALRTEINKEMYGLAGGDGNYKDSYKALQEMKNDPEMGEMINNMEGKIIDLDKKLLSTPDSSYEKPAFVKAREKKLEQFNGAQQPVGTGAPKQSRAYKRLLDTLAAEDPATYEKVKDDPKLTYQTLNQKYDFENAMNIVAKDPQKAYNIAKQFEAAPVGQRWESVNIVLADRALQDKNYGLWKDLEQSRSLSQTRAGQGIVAEKGRFNDNSPHTFVQQLLDARMRRLGGETELTKAIDMTKKFLGKTTNSAKERAVAKIDQVVEKARQFTKKERAKIDFAQKLLDDLTCK